MEQQIQTHDECDVKKHGNTFYLILKAQKMEFRRGFTNIYALQINISNIYKKILKSSYAFSLLQTRIRH